MRRARFMLVAGVLALLALYAGVHFVQPRPPRHPLTGRQIAGVATDTAWLDRAARQQEEAPEQALALIDIRAGMTVADVGAGTGYMTVRLARLVGPDGKVYANDIQPAMLRVIREKTQAEPLANVELVQGTGTDARLPASAIDVALLVDVYHELSHPQEILRSIGQSLKRDGRLVLVEYRKEDPTIPIAETHRLSLADARTEVEAEGFAFDRAIETLPRQHIFIFRKASRAP